MPASPKVLVNDNDYRDGFPVTPSDALDLVADPGNTIFYPRANAISIAAAGNLSVITPNGKTLTYTGLTAGQTINVPVQRVKATGTTATVVALIR